MRNRTDIAAERAAMPPGDAVTSTAAAHVRPYLSAEQLAALTPWTTEAIEKLIQRGVLVRGKHFFQPCGRRSQRIFKWAAVVDLIEGRATSIRETGMLKSGLDEPAIGSGIDVEEATTALRRLFD